VSLFSSLRTRVVLTTVITLLPAIGGVLYLQGIERARVRERTLQNTLRIARLAADQQGAVIQAARQQLITLALFPGVRTGGADDCLPLFETILRQHPDYNSLTISDANGNWVCGSPRPREVPRATDRAWFQRAVRTGTVALGDYQVSRLTRKPDIVIAAPIVDAGGRVQRVVATALGLDQLNRVIAAAALPPGGTLTLFDRQGTIVARYPDPDQSVGRRVPDDAMLQRLAGGADLDVSEAPGVDGVARLFATVPVGRAFHAGLYLGIGVDRTTMFAEVHRILVRDLTVLALMAIVALGVALVSSELLVLAPVRALIGATRRLAGGDLQARAPVAAVRELGDLGEAFNGMAAAIAARELERDRAEEQMRQAQKMQAVGQLAGGIAHDFNNLLTVIITGLDLLGSDLPEEAPHRALVDSIGKAATRAASLTQQLLAYSRRQTLSVRAIDLAELLGEQSAMLRRLVPSSVTMEVEAEPELPLVRVDPRQIEQVILNLVVNAADAMPAGGAISVTAARADLRETDRGRDPDVVPGPYVRLTVRDTGHGMDAATMGRVFEPFFTTKPFGKGAGLGLSTAYGIVKQSGGYLWVDSRLGRGTTFTIHLPVHRERLATAV
jgi:signal transduction histidine kinase